jgi:glycerophosphoryl diester phosphodiesterase
MPAFAACVELSIGFELDIYSSRDDQLVVIHNSTPKLTTNGPDRPVGEFSLEELKRLDAGKKKKTAIYNFSGSDPPRRAPATWDQVRQSGVDGLLTDFPLECRLHWRTRQ